VLRAAIQEDSAVANVPHGPATGFMKRATVAGRAREEGEGEVGRVGDSTCNGRGGVRTEEVARAGSLAPPGSR
jgi:hypothetical protein